MEGLEVLEIRYSTVIQRGRIDAESYERKSIELADRLSVSAKVQTIEQVAEVSDGNHLSIASEFGDEKLGVRYLRGQDINGQMMLDDRNPVFIPVSEYEKLSRSHIYVGDVLITIVGANTGQTALVDVAPEKLTANCKLGIVRAKTALIEPAYLHAFLAGRYGQSQVAAAKRGGGQMGLILPDLKSLKVPRFSSTFESYVSRLSVRAHELKRTVGTHIERAETALLNALGLDVWSPSKALSYVRSSREVFAAGRLDAEHFHVHHTDIEAKIRAYEGGYTSIGVLAHDLMNGAEVREYQDEGIAYLRVGDIKHLDVDANSVVRIDPMAAEKGLEKIPLRAGDVLISRSGSLAVTAVVEPAWEDALISSHLIRLRIADKRIDPYFLALYLACLPGKSQVIKWSNGGVQPEISQPSLNEILVPIVDLKLQKQIRENILLSRKQRQESARLLDAAKRAVEIAIEDSETAALNYLESFK